MTVGFVILAHTRLDRVRQLACWLAAAGAPVTVHLDRRVPAGVQQALAGDVSDRVEVFAEHAAEWGQFGMVSATLAAVDRLLARSPDLGHVVLLSGSCLPLRPVADLQRFLSQHPDRDFIESVPVAEGGWVEDGLSHERFTLYHPFSHRRRPWLFSRSVNVQRALKVRRTLPPGLQPHLGRQWWCLSAKTLRALLSHPDKPDWDRFFNGVWIPDEAYFQTLVRVLRQDVEPGASLHLNRFNPRGRPVTFHDDHVELLRTAEHFFARKIDPDASGLYRTFLAEEPLPPVAQRLDERRFAEARREVAEEGRGRLSASRLPKGTTLTRCDTVRPYLAILTADADLASRLPGRLEALAPDAIVHGRLFPPALPSRFACGSVLYTGNLPGTSEFRDYRPAQFLAQLVWGDRERRTVFMIQKGDEQGIRFQLVQDPNARLLVLAPEAQARAWLKDLERPFDVRGPASRRPLVPRRWARWLEPSTSGPEHAVAEAGRILGADWDDPVGWQVPQ